MRPRQHLKRIPECPASETILLYMYCIEVTKKNKNSKEGTTNSERVWQVHSIQKLIQNLTQTSRKAEMSIISKGTSLVSGHQYFEGFEGDRALIITLQSTTVQQLTTLL